MVFPALAAFLLQATVVFGLALVVRRLLRERISAAARYRMVFLVAVCLPLMAASTAFEVRASARPAMPRSRSLASAAFSSDPASVQPAATDRLFPIEVPARLADILVAVWAAVALFRLGSSLAARRETARSLRCLTPCRDPAWVSALATAVFRLEVRRPIRLLDGGELPPFTAGGLGTTIVVPAAEEGWTRERREAVLFHEAAHVRRCDVLRMAYLDCVASAAWCVPTMSAALRALAEDREEACDEEAIAHGAKPSVYASVLLELTAALPPAPPRAALGMTHRTRTEARIRRIVDREGRVAERRLSGKVATAALLVIGLLIGGVGPLSRVFALQEGGPAGSIGDANPASALPRESPLAGEWTVTQKFGRRTNPITGKPYQHLGLDLANGRAGDPVLATVAGTVMEAGYDEGSGNHVAVGDGRVLVRFSKLQDIRVAVGDRLRIGSVLGTVGATGIATGPHLHYEIWVDGSAVDPAIPLLAGGARFSGLADE